MSFYTSQTTPQFGSGVLSFAGLTTQRTFTFPNYTATIATLAGTETLTNKTLNGSNNTFSNISLTTAVTGILPVANGGNGVSSLPTFSVVKSPASSQSVANSTATKVTWGGEIWDNTNAFASDRFTPQVAGYYDLNVAILFASSGAYTYQLYIYKNGSVEKVIASINQAQTASGNCLVFLNGTTDYVEVYVWQNSGGSVNILAADANTFFQGQYVCKN